MNAKPTQPQLALLEKLRGEFSTSAAEYSRLTGNPVLAKDIEENGKDSWRIPANKHDASDMIDTLIRYTLPRIRQMVRETRPSSEPQPKYAEVEDGMYIEASLNTNGQRIFKIQRAVHGSGNQYAKELIEGKFTYAPGLIRFVKQHCRRMTLEDAKKYGALYGTCCVCGRTLTDENSIEAGIGPVCAGRL